MGCTSSKEQTIEPKPTFLSETEKRSENITESEKKQSSPVFIGVVRGLLLLSRDEFVSKYTGETMFRWRKAEIVDFEGEDRSRVLVHYVNWADTFDYWVDLKSEHSKLAPIFLLSKEQCNKGLPLDDDQRIQAFTYFTTRQTENISDKPALGFSSTLNLPFWSTNAMERLSILKVGLYVRFFQIFFLSTFSF